MEDNKIVKRILELRKTYVFRHLFAGCYVGTDVENMIECDCCGTLSSSLESLYHKDNNNCDTIHICSNCSELWRAIGTKEIEEKNISHE